jgi:phytoene dehydrogenase-like protein
MKPVLQLFDQIMALKGSRQVTVATSYIGARTYDVSEAGVIGYHAAHRDSLLEHLQEAVENGGGVVVRQFQAEKVLPESRRPSLPLTTQLRIDRSAQYSKVPRNEQIDGFQVFMDRRNFGCDRDFGGHPWAGLSGC